MKTSFLCTGAITLALCTPVQADYLEEIVVVANRTEQSLAESMASVEVIGAEELAASQSQDLLDLLSGRAGISLARDGGTGKNTSLFMRGTDSDHTLVYIDSQPINGLSDGRARLEYMPLDQLERIEIVRGARSSLYGSEAIGGVIRLFTRRHDEPSMGGNLSLTGGSHDYQSVAADGHISTGTTGLSASFSDTDVEGFDSRVTDNPDRDGYENRSWRLSAHHEFANDNSVRLQQSRTDGSTRYDESGWVAGADGSDDYVRMNTSLDVNLELSSNWQSEISLARFKDAYDNVGSFGPFISDSRRDSASWLNHFTLSSGQRASLGVDYTQDTYEGNSRAEAKRDNLALLALLETGTETFPVAISVRNDNNEQYGNHLTGSISTGFNSSDMGNFWATLGTAFKAPNFLDLDPNFGGDPNLEPEESQNYELGWRYLTSDTNYSASVFRIRTKNLIEYDSMFQVVNSGDVEITGFELDAETDLAGYIVGASFTHLNHENLDTGEELVRRPRNTLRLDASRSFGELTLTLVGLAQSERSDINDAELDGYELLDLLVSYQLVENLNVRGKLGNLFDRDYQLVDGFNTAGRSFQASVNYSF